ncbi:MAG: hypothetical protein J2P41_16710 [Blastocatellia bacterium]|nr:hypothetical protein [Blastocatellia bacterium]
MLRHDSDLRPVVHKIFEGLDKDDECPHLIWGTTTAFHDKTQYFRDVLKELVEANECQRSELAEVGIELAPLSSTGDWAATREHFVEYISRVADNLPDLIGSYAIVIDPESIDDPREYEESILFLADNTESKRVKYIVLDRQAKPLLPDIEKHNVRIAAQVFRFSPREVERHVKDDLDRNSELSPAEHRQYNAMLGTFAYTRKNYVEAERRQHDVLNQSLKSGETGEQAIAYYNLGNTYLSSRKPRLAEECFTKAGELCLAAQSAPLLAMIMTNLGLALAEGGQLPEAMDSFDSACLTFQGIENHIGSAYSLDCKATVLAKAGRKNEAEMAWRRALAIYDSIEGEAMRNTRESGRKDILKKLNRLFRR